MPALQSLHGLAFDPEHVQVMLTAFDDACAKLHLRKGDKMTDLVALKIVDLAKSGERDAHRLLVLVIREFGSGSPGAIC
jgi:hypothetical protein